MCESLGLTAGQEIPRTRFSCGGIMTDVLCGGYRERVSRNVPIERNGSFRFICLVGFCRDFKIVA